MFDALINGTDLEKGIFVTVFGMLGVFAVLILFYLIIRIFSGSLFRKKAE
ncbi:MAG TPA: OadG family protein [Clostridiales bacterium]|jgi:Na+-transporting methylmalonyl-CoA/oxaloacetate decarboxylase gamma subunit|nr:OadG family protein [Clostridiaceae bacterium]HOQ08438.1 OadG family protein [Clostridiales bacterium]HPV02676.1 OadG family protein [Clostridiales bacterium]